jgi:hypothetical protein
MYLKVVGNEKNGGSRRRSRTEAMEVIYCLNMQFLIKNFISFLLVTEELIGDAVQTVTQ